MKLLPKSPKRLMGLVALLLAVVGGERWYRHWQPTLVVETEHYVIRSSATAEQTQEIGAAVETLYTAYGKVFGSLPEVGQPHPKFRLNLFGSREEFRRCNRGIAWAEGFYQTPYGNGYFSAAELNPRHWMVHEAVHQLNHEVVRLNAAKWIDEGLATYFSTSMIKEGTLIPGQIDRSTYPIWWLDDLNLTGDMAKDIATTNIIPMRAILANQGGPDLNEFFNLYYLHWWSLSHFLFQFEDGKYRVGYLRLIREGGTVENFEKEIGPVERVQKEWYGHLRSLQGRPYSPPRKAKRAAANTAPPRHGLETQLNVVLPGFPDSPRIGS